MGTCSADNWKAKLWKAADDAFQAKDPDMQKKDWGYAAMLLDRAKPEDLELARRILSGAAAAPADSIWEGPTLAHIYLRYNGLLDDASKASVRDFLVRWVAGCRDLWAVTRMGFEKFSNVNINLTALCGLLSAGQALGNDLLSQVAFREIERLVKWIDWQQDVDRGMGTYSEFNCPEYTAVCIRALARAADVCPPGPMKDGLLNIEGRFWTDAALFYHEPTNLLSGPHARSYRESCVGPSSMELLFHIVSQGRTFISDSSSPEDLGISFHVPDRARMIAFEKIFPFYVQVNGFCGGWHYGTYVDDPGGGMRSYPYTPGIRYAEHAENYPAHYIDIRSYQTAEYSLGTCSLPYTEGWQNNAFMLRWRRAPAIQAPSDIRSVYTRYIKNEKKQGQSNYYERMNFEWGPRVLVEEGRVACLQHKNKAIVLYRPREVENLGNNSLKLNILMTCVADFDELQVGDSVVSTFPFDFDWRQPLYIRDGGVYVAFMFLDPADFGRRTPCRIAKEGDHLVVSIYNYEGPRRDFDRTDMFLMHNGFVCEVREAREFPSLDAFKAHMVRTTRLTERRYGPCREVTYTSDDVLEVCFDAEKERFLHRAVNGAFNYPERMLVLAKGQEDPDLCPRRIW